MKMISSSEKKHSNQNKISLYFYKANNFFLICGLPGFVKWGKSEYTSVKYKYIQCIVSCCIFMFIALELGSFITQKNLTAKQASDMLFLGLSHPILTSYRYALENHKKKVRDLLYKLCIELKNIYNDPQIEQMSIKNSTIYSLAFLLNEMSALISYGFEATLQVLFGDGTFVTVVTAWPDVTDKSIGANIGRVIGYLMWWVCLQRVCGVFVLFILTIGSLRYQFKNLQSYFYSLNDIFAEGDFSETNQGNAERKYEKALKVGIHLHAETLWCTRQCQVVCSFVYSAQIIVNVAVMCVLMLQMVNSERSLATAFTIVIASGALLSSTGILMWNAGDVTFEAALVPTAMYSSGWQNCRGVISQRIRKLMVIAMNEAQRPVVIRSFGIMDISYQAFVSMVKASYSAFSFLY